MSKFFFRHSHSFRRENYFSLSIPPRVLAYTSILDSFHNTHFSLFFGCFTAKHFISYQWKAIRRYSIWRSEGLATSYIAVKLDYRMWQLPEIHAKILRIKKKKFGLDAHFSYYSRLKLFIAIRRPNIFRKSRMVTFQGSFWNLNCP